MTAMTLDEAAAWPLAAIPDVHVPLVLTALEPLAHGAGNAGNTQLLRTQDIILPDGRRTSVPYISGSSLRHELRSALAWHLCRTLGIPDRSLPKAAVDLLWSGGSLSETGAQADLARAGAVHGRLPGLGLLGYAARSDITSGTLYAQNVHLVCAENAYRLPAPLRGHPHAALPAGAFRSEEFGTRHDVAGTPAARYIALLGGRQDTVQMIWDQQVIKPGAVLWSGLSLASGTPGHAAALAAAFSCAAPLRDGARVMYLGGKRAQGSGMLKSCCGRDSRCTCSLMTIPAMTTAARRNRSARLRTMT